MSIWIDGEGTAWFRPREDGPRHMVNYDRQLQSLCHGDFFMRDLLEKSPTGVICNSKISWTDWDGSRTSTESGYYPSVREARKNALRSAVRMGWTPPRWWQWWRWDDTKVDLDFSRF